MDDSLRQVMDRGFLQYYVLFGLKVETISYSAGFSVSGFINLQILCPLRIVLFEV